MKDHWERMIAANDLMNINRVSDHQYFTAMDVAILKDTGWYTFVDASVAETMRWG